ncbi:hypothetical protein [Tatumella punctata]|uniref:Uncharacterized protein n=1 Tax=Tatumella punctata TaxID=399969 RepID=A0ABW1VQN3_9GAMM
MAKHIKAVPLPETSEGFSTVYRGETEKINPHARGNIVFELGINPATDTTVLRLASNQGSGLFSSEWIEISAIESLLSGLPESFSSREFAPLFSHKSRNNPGFLAAVLRSPEVCLIEASPDAVFMHKCFPDLKHRADQLNIFIKKCPVV